MVMKRGCYGPGHMAWVKVVLIIVRCVHCDAYMHKELSKRLHIGYKPGCYGPRPVARVKGVVIKVNFHITRVYTNDTITTALSWLKVWLLWAKAGC